MARGGVEGDAGIEIVFGHDGRPLEAVVGRAATARIPLRPVVVAATLRLLGRVAPGRLRVTVSLTVTTQIGSVT